jgi:peptidoglycan/LPS O-acetylase OafA/YrhL
VFHRLRDLPVALLAAGSLALMTPMAWAYLLTGSPYHPWSWVVRVLCGFGAGVLAHLVVRRLQDSSGGVRRRASAIAAALPLVVAAGLVAGELIGPGRGGAVLVAFPVLVGALALADRGPATWLARPVMVYGGRISYSLYLVHIPMFEVFWLAQEHYPQALGRSTGLAHVVGLAVLVATVPVAALVHGLVEEPARLRLARLADRRPEPAPTRPIVFIPAPVGPVRTGWSSATVAPHPRRAGSLHRRIAPGSRTVTVVEYVQRVL